MSSSEKGRPLGLGSVTPEALTNLDALNAQLQASPLPNRLRASIEADWEVSQTYNSNAIEGNTLTLAETKAVLLHGITVSGHPLREHLEAVNHRDAWRMMRRLAAEAVAICEQDILDLHKIILTGIQSEDAGIYRRERVRVVGSSLIFPNSLKVPELMADFATGLQNQNVHPVIHAAHAHYQFVAIHPFIDGNGRTARLLMNFLLLQAGYPAALIPVNERAAYYSALEQANNSDLLAFESLVIRRVTEGIRDLLTLTD